MQGFDRTAARETLNVPPDVRIEIMVAIGNPSDPAILAERDRTREQPSQRHPLTDIENSGAYESE